MSEVQARPSAPRGRGSARGGRGGYGSRGRGGRPAPTNGDFKDSSQLDSSEDQGEIGEMKKQYSSQLSTLKELFPDWSDVDLIFALQECNGDLQTTIERISEGMSSILLTLSSLANQMNLHQLYAGACADCTL